MPVTEARRFQIHMNIDVPVDVADALDVFCKKRNVKKKAVVELALRRYLTDEADADEAARDMGGA